MAALLSFAACSTTPAPEPELAEVWKLRDQRVGAERLRQSCVAEDPEIRRAAARALGALGDGGSAATLGGLLDDPDPTVRFASAFALGQLGSDSEAAQWLMPALLAEDPNLRMAAVRSLGFVGGAAQSEALLRALNDKQAVIRGEAAIALARLCGDPARGREPAPGISEGVIATLADGIADRLRKERHPEARWRMTWALSQLVLHIASEAMCTTLLGVAGEPSAVQRNPAERAACAFAIRGLGKLEHDEGLLDVLLPLTQDRDPVIAVEAVRASARALTAKSAETGAKARVVLSLTGAARSHPAPAVRAAACEGLGQLPPAEGDRSGLREVLEAACKDESVPVQMAALPAFVRQFDEAASVAVAKARFNGDWRLRVAAMQARAISGVGPVQAYEDPDIRVRRAALKAWVPPTAQQRARAAITTGVGWSSFLAFAGERDIAMRETLAEVLAATGDDHWVPMLLDAYRDSEGPEFAEPRKLLLGAVLELDPDGQQAKELLQEAIEDPNQVVRRAAAKAMAARGEEVPPEMLFPDPVDSDVPGAGIPLEFLDMQPVVRMVTDKGEIDIALIPQLAPIHCWNLMKLAAVGHYDGKPIHRVVANFVIQGGDLRGDGYGNVAWHGGTLRDEINEIPFTTGTLGAPRTADPDTAGGQFFITLLPTPGLDGEYTAFGRVVRGMRVVESIELGDIVQRVGLLVDGEQFSMPSPLR